MNEPTKIVTTGAGTPSDEELAQRVQRGCVRSYEELDRRLRSRLVYLLTKRTGNREDAEDLAQQALMRAYQKIGGYDPGRRFRAWLFTIAVRLSIDAYRRRGVNASGGEGIERVVDPGDGPAETVSRREGQRRLWSLADRVLDPTQRTALWLHYGEQLKAKEIATTLGISAAHVRVVLYRARRALLKHLQPANEIRPVAAKPVRIQHPRPTMKEGALS